MEAATCKPYLQVRVEAARQAEMCRSERCDVRSSDVNKATIECPERAKLPRNLFMFNRFPSAPPQYDTVLM